MDVLTLAREGEQVDDIEPVGLANAAKNSWQTVKTGQATLETSTSRSVEADQNRIRQLFENLYRNAVEHGGENVTVSVGAMEDFEKGEADGSHKALEVVDAATRAWQTLR